MIFKVTKHTRVELIYKKFSDLLMPLLLVLKVSPNQVTFFAGILGIIGAFSLLLNTAEGFIFSAVLINISATLDVADGQLASKRQMHSKLGRWLDPYFDKLNDLILITCLSIALFVNDSRVEIVALGLILMGLIFFNQFLMVFNDNTSLKDKESNHSNSGKSSSFQVSNSNIFKYIFKSFPGLGELTFLFVISFFIFTHGLNLYLDFINFNILFFGTCFIALWSFLTLVKITIYDVYRLFEYD